jgi:hypothetical protein
MQKSFSDLEYGAPEFDNLIFPASFFTESCLKKQAVAFSAARTL